MLDGEHAEGYQGSTSEDAAGRLTVNCQDKESWVGGWLGDNGPQLVNCVQVLQACPTH